MGYLDHCFCDTCGKIYATLENDAVPRIQIKGLSSVYRSCLTLCDPMDCSIPGLPVNQLLELTQTHVH